MPNQTVTLEMPSDLYSRLKKRAEQSNRTVENETLELLAATVTPEDQIAFEIRHTVDSMALLDDAALERAAHSHLLTEFAEELEALHLKQQREPLTDAESKRNAELIRAYERSMLIRAHAAAQLKKRGVDISRLVVQP